MSKKHLDAAIKLYEKFYSFDARSVVESKLSMPSRAKRLGRMKAVMYASDKWEKQINYYKHDHEEGVHLYEPTSSSCASGCVKVPRFIASCKAMTKLGRCVGIVFMDGDKEVPVMFSGCHLYAIPSGRALVILRGTEKIEAMIWGGRLTVEGRGIVY